MPNYEVTIKRRRMVDESCTTVLFATDRASAEELALTMLEDDEYNALFCEDSSEDVTEPWVEVGEEQSLDLDVEEEEC